MTPICLPLPPNSLRVNRTIGQHWSSGYNEKGAYQLQCVGAWKDAGRPMCASVPVHLQAVVYLGKSQRCDAVDALTWAKPGLDALSRLAWRDDGSKYLNPVTVEVRRDWERPRIELTWEG